MKRKPLPPLAPRRNRTRILGNSETTRCSQPWSMSAEPVELDEAFLRVQKELKALESNSLLPDVVQAYDAEEVSTLITIVVDGVRVSENDSPEKGGVMSKTEASIHLHPHTRRIFATLQSCFQDIRRAFRNRTSGMLRLNHCRLKYKVRDVNWLSDELIEKRRQVVNQLFDKWLNGSISECDTVATINACLTDMFLCLPSEHDLENLIWFPVILRQSLSINAGNFSQILLIMMQRAASALRCYQPFSAVTLDWRYAKHSELFVMLQSFLSKWLFDDMFGTGDDGVILGFTSDVGSTLVASPLSTLSTASFGCNYKVTSKHRDLASNGLWDDGWTVFPFALVLSPTRELASQIYEEAKKFAYQSGVKVAVVYGGAPMVQQLRDLERGLDILVATPGRLVDMIERSRVSLKMIKYLALDEADRMLDMGFEPQIRQIVQQMDMPPPAARQTLLFSATFPDEIQRLTADFLKNYIFLTVGKVGSSTDLIAQKVELVRDMDKTQHLCGLLKNQRDNGTRGKLALTLVFVETKKGANQLENWLSRNGFPAIAIHGDKVQMERERALRLFKCGTTPILVATDVASRGLDIPHVSHVINFDFPKSIDDYVHRIGRTGRAGKSGLATAFFSEKNQPLAKSIVELMKGSKQDVPNWLNDYAQQSSPYGGDQSQRYGSSNFGGYDFRRSENHYGGSGSYGYGASDSSGYGGKYGNSYVDEPAASYNGAYSGGETDADGIAGSSSFGNFLRILRGAIAIGLVCHVGETLQITKSYLHRGLYIMCWLHPDVILETTCILANFKVAFGSGLTILLPNINEDVYRPAAIDQLAILSTQIAWYGVIGATLVMSLTSELGEKLSVSDHDSAKLEDKFLLKGEKCNESL